jgi:hypothetical protein
MKSPQNLAIQDKYKFGDACGQPSKETNDSGNNNHSQTARRANPGARIQAALLLPLWLAFMVGWWRVLRNGPAADLARSFELLAGIAALYGLTLVLWIRHNVGIWQRKGPRRTVRAVAAHYTPTMSLGMQSVAWSPRRFARSISSSKSQAEKSCTAHRAALTSLKVPNIMPIMLQYINFGMIAGYSGRLSEFSM